MIPKSLVGYLYLCIVARSFLIITAELPQDWPISIGAVARVSEEAPNLKADIRVFIKILHCDFMDFMCEWVGV